MGIEQTNAHLSSMDQSTQKLSDSVAEDEKYLKAFSEQMLSMQQNMQHLDTGFAADQEYIKGVADCMKSLSDSLLGLQKMGDNALQLVMKSLLSKDDVTPAKTPDAEDLLPPVSQ